MNSVVYAPAPAALLSRESGATRAQAGERVVDLREGQRTSLRSERNSSRAHPRPALGDARVHRADITPREILGKSDQDFKPQMFETLK